MKYTRYLSKHDAVQGETDFPESLVDRDSYEEARSSACKSGGPRIPSLDQQQHLADSAPSNRAKRTRSTARDSFARECALSLSRGAVKIGVLSSLSRVHETSFIVGRRHWRREMLTASDQEESESLVDGNMVPILPQLAPNFYACETRISRQERSSAAPTRRRLRVKNGRPMDRRLPSRERRKGKSLAKRNFEKGNFGEIYFVRKTEEPYRVNLFAETQEFVVVIISSLANESLY